MTVVQWNLCALVVGFAIPLELANAGLAGLERVASGLTNPIYVTHAPNDPERLFILESGTPFGTENASASIRILNLATGTIESEPFLTISDVSTNSQGGALGMTFHPDYANNGKFYVNMTAADDIEGSVFSSYIREYTVSADRNVANTTYTPIVTWRQASGNHNGGWLGFSPVDGYLYIPTGDGGCCNDFGVGHEEPMGNAQTITDNLLGKILRLDVSGDDFPLDPNRNYRIPDSNPFADVRHPETREVVSAVVGDDEIWAYGLRNPFRGSFDRLTGDLWLGDVGEGTREEVNFQPASSLGGENYGWRLREGTIANPKEGIGGEPPPGNVDPVYEYSHIGSLYHRTVIGGYVYRGPDPELQGKYFFADSGSYLRPDTQRIWMFDPSSPYTTVTDIRAQLAPDTGNPTYPVSFGEDANGNLYIVFLDTSDVYRIVTDSLLTGDYNADGKVDDADYEMWQSTFGSTVDAGSGADGNGSGRVGSADYTIWRDNVGNSVLDAGNGSVGVPEPANMLLVSALIVPTFLRRRRQSIMD